MVCATVFLLLAACVFTCQGARRRQADQSSESRYDGQPMGNLDTGVHGVHGKVYAAAADTLVLQDFSYDGREPGAYIVVGTADKPDGKGVVLTNYYNKRKQLKASAHERVLLRLPAGKKITDFKWLSVYSRKAKRSFAHVNIPADLDYPRSATVATRIGGKHANATAVIVKDKKTLLLVKFYYDGWAKDAYFMAGKGDHPGPKGIKVPDEKGKIRRGEKTTGKNVRLSLPGNITVDDIDWISLYCANCTEPLLEIRMPKDLNVPPSIQSLKRKPKKSMLKFRQGAIDNCETIVAGKIQVGWKIQGDIIMIELTALAMPGMWTAFGISGEPDKSAMVGADVAVVFIAEKDSKISIVDHFLSIKSQCSGPSGGVCDDKTVGGKEDLTLKKSSYTNGVLNVVYERKLKTGDSKDKDFPNTGSVAVVAGQGPVNRQQPDLVLYHTMVVTRETVLLAFDRPPKRNCPPLKAEAELPSDVDMQEIGGRDILKKENVDTFHVRIGPTAGRNGYERITGGAGWGLAFWINKELIPVLHVERGKTYTFIVETGDKPERGAEYHPFYITDSSKGGASKEDKANLNKKGNMLYAGVVLGADGNVDLTKGGVGRLCRYKEGLTYEKAKTPAKYKEALQEVCVNEGKAGNFTWTPDANTPDLVYYQCFTHNYLGWKISVTNPGQADPPLGTPSRKPPPPRTPPRRPPSPKKPPSRPPPPPPPPPPPAPAPSSSGKGGSPSTTTRVPLTAVLLPPLLLLALRPRRDAA